MGMYNANFRPVDGSVVANSALVNVTATSAAAALPGPNAGDTEQTYRLHNAGPSVVFWAWGTGSTTVLANGTSTMLPVGNTEIFDAPRGATHIATIGEGGTARLFITRGEGS